MLKSNHWTRTPSTDEPVSVIDVRNQLRLPDSSKDNDFVDLITIARLECETKLGDISLLNATCVDYFDTFEDGMELHWGPVSAINSITYVDTNGDTQTLSTDVYELGTKLGVGFVRLKHNQTFPSTRGHSDDVTVTYTAGYGEAASSVPNAIKQWIKAYAAWLFNNADGEQYAFKFDSVLSPFKRIGVHG
jgi:uncharacterized phiE125 gp8 family phage protein